MTSLQATADGDGSLLDNTLLLYGAGMSEADVHSPYNLPTMVVGGPRFGVKGGRHVRVAKDTPLTNLHLTLLEKMGVRIDWLGDSTGELNTLSAV